MRAQKSKMGTMDQKWNIISYSEPEIYARLKKKKKVKLFSYKISKNLPVYIGLLQLKMSLCPKTPIVSRICKSKMHFLFLTY